MISKKHALQRLSCFSRLRSATQQVAKHSRKRSYKFNIDVLRIRDTALPKHMVREYNIVSSCTLALG